MLPDQFKSLKLISDCPVCRQKKFPSEINLLDEQPEGHLIHVQCKTCQSCIVVLVSLNEQGMNLIGILTDLGSKEVKEFINRGPLSSDDIINLHENLKNKEFIQSI
ncbi:hypothetical protein HQ571_06215 [Candidatus Kuenenbacteria bacterium]|nr:hypothetical protein [Candidatus Kuenenbacteria bacterium]